MVLRPAVASGHPFGERWSKFDALLSPYIAHNDLPPEDVISDLKVALVQPRQDLQQVKQTIKVLSLTLDALKRRCEDLEDGIATYEPILSPMRRLPDDMLEEIFYHCLPAHRNPIPLTTECPLVLTMVCRKWRAVSLAAPRLWSRLHISFEVEPRYYNLTDDFVWPIRVAGLHQWLNRSGALPLSLSLYCNDSVYGDMFDPSFAREVLMVVRQHAHRCASLEMRLSQDILNMMHTIIDIRPEVFPVLTTMRHCPSYGSATTADAAQTLFSHWLALPTLREIHLATYSAPPHLTDASSLFRWPLSLTRLSLHMGSNRYILLNILRQCTLLEECALIVDNFDLQLTDPEESEPICADKITLPHLKTLSIDGEQDGQESICGQLDAPALTHFLFFPPCYGTRYQTINRELDHVPRPAHSPLLTFLSSCRSLEILTLNSARIIGADFQAILEATPTVTTLILDHRLSSFHRSSFTENTRPEWCNFDYNLYPLLNQEFRSKTLDTAVPLEQPLLPNLKSFTLFSHLQHSDAHMYHDLLIDFCNNRIRGAGHPSASTDTPSLANTDATTDIVKPAPAVASLEYIKITLDGLIDSNTAEPGLELIEVDIEADIAKHAESVGKVVGKDLNLDISYPWVDAPQHIPLKTGPISVKEGLDYQTDYTWPYVD
ncbi:hypothetical protein BJ165DRAFT_607688 [Panaeolus papilionaceus]|nr:hypothetical protein BJ165DRAFT_607688 [Panaeolus papilionaceus]